LHAIGLNGLAEWAQGAPALALWVFVPSKERTDPDDVNDYLFHSDEASHSE
jgi:hypothetical protein